jgi:2-oxoglutarate dehydrogenase E1 component
MDKRNEPVELKPEKYGFTEQDLDREVFAGSDNLISGFLSSDKKVTTIREVLKRLKETYCGTIGVEYMHIQERDQCDWIRERFETPRKYSFPAEDRMRILDRLAWADQFERFLNTKYKQSKRFGLDGCESLIPGLKALVDTASDLGVNSIVIGMPHRGRLNVLANVVRKPLKVIFNEFNGGVVTPELGDEYSPSGDVKYHLGTSYNRPTRSGKHVHLSLVANPSHLEAVDPVVEGKTRAKQHYANDTERSQVMPIIMHGDAAFAGQGVVYETLHLSYLKNYTTGGTIHVIVNNQIGFTTDPKSSRSSLYCTDVAKTIGAPIFHVNGDDPEAVVHVMQLAAAWRQTFKKDVIVDIVCYRRYGHNEIDQPHFTQPIMYQKIEQQVPILKKYSDQLIADKVITKEQYDEMIKTITGIYEQGFQEGLKTVPRASEWLESRWEGFKSPAQLARISQTGIPEETLKKIGQVLYTLPEGFTPHKTLKKNMGEKAAMFETGKGFDWATAEALAFGSLMLEKNHVRLSGQDVERGTFSHRHAVLHDQKDGSTYTPLSHLSPEQAAFTVSNSSLSEFAVLGFELGYSLENPNSLILWEAQFGDFANGAQVIIDQFISSGEMKWMRQSGLTLLLPHGYDGAGPEHSSARLERFLQLCDSDPTKVPPKDEGERKQMQHANWCIVMCTTPANYFHVLRRQVHRDFRKPLICMTSKWLLRYQPSFSKLSDFTDSSATPRFLRVIPEATPEAINPPAKVTRVVFCSGQVYYHILKARADNNVKDVAIVRLEQLYPFPFDLVSQQAELYPNADIVWCQEEPMNMGAWNFVFPHLLTAIPKRAPTYAGRPVSASPAVASGKLHDSQQISFLSHALRTKISQP